MRKKDIYNGDNEFISIGNYLFDDKKRKSNKKTKNKILYKNDGKVSNLEKLISNGGLNKTKLKPNNFIDDILLDKITFLRQILDEINTQMKDRDSLKHKIHNKIDYGICYIQTKLYETDPWGIGNNREIDTRRSKLENELEALKKQKRDEARECWRDISNLKKEHRQFFHEYRNSLRRVKVIFPDRFKK